MQVAAAVETKVLERLQAAAWAVLAVLETLPLWVHLLAEQSQQRSVLAVKVATELPTLAQTVQPTRATAAREVVLRQVAWVEAADF
jgi:hypothetical protein